MALVGTKSEDFPPFDLGFEPAKGFAYSTESGDLSSHGAKK